MSRRPAVAAAAARHARCVAPAWLLAAAAAAGPGAAAAALVEETVTIPVQVAVARPVPDPQASGRAHAMFSGMLSRTLVVVVVRDASAARAPRPLALLLHGRPIDRAARAALAPTALRPHARWLARRGFVAAVPVRIGYGATGGPDVEESFDCDAKRWAPAFDVAVEQAAQVVASLRRRGVATAAPALVVGHSFGGMVALALAARDDAGVGAVVNLAGGAGGNPATRPGRPCSPERLAEWLGATASTTRPPRPTLWLHAASDRFFGPEWPRRWADAYRRGGGDATFVDIPAPADPDGHDVADAGAARWQPWVRAFAAGRLPSPAPRPSPPSPPPRR